MTSLEDIRQKLLAGQKAKDLVKSGLPRSSVYAEAKKLRSQLPAAGDELADLRQQKEVLKLKAEIADILAIKGKLPDRVATLEKEVVGLRQFVRAAVNGALFNSVTYATGLAGKTVSQEQMDFCDGWVERVIEGS